VPNGAIPGRWVNAIDLRVGDILFTRDGRRVPVTKVSVRHVQTKVYNLQVAELENYTVGHSGILVHNTSGVPQPPNRFVIPNDLVELYRMEQGLVQTLKNFPNLPNVPGQPNFAFYADLLKRVRNAIANFPR
jgi:hypothetical protein